MTRLPPEPESNSTASVSWMTIRTSCTGIVRISATTWRNIVWAPVPVSNRDMNRSTLPSASIATLAVDRPLPGGWSEIAMPRPKNGPDLGPSQLAASAAPRRVSSARIS